MLMAGMAPEYESADNEIHWNKSLMDWRKKTADIELWLDAPAGYTFQETNQRMTMYEAGFHGNRSRDDWQRAVRRVSIEEMYVGTPERSLLCRLFKQMENESYVPINATKMQKFMRNKKNFLAAPKTAQEFDDMGLPDMSPSKNAPNSYASEMAKKILSTLSFHTHSTPDKGLSEYCEIVPSTDKERPGVKVFLPDNTQIWYKEVSRDGIPLHGTLRTLLCGIPLHGTLLCGIQILLCLDRC